MAGKTERFEVVSMKYHKIREISGAIMLCAILVNGCGRLSSGFSSGEEAKEYVLNRLEKKYKQAFIFTEEPEYKEEKAGLRWIKGGIAPESEPSETAYVYARDTGFFEDDYHVYYFKDGLEKLAKPLCKDKDYIEECAIEVRGKSTDTLWTGKETLEEYLRQGEYEIYVNPRFPEGKTDDEYADEILTLLNELYESGLNITLTVSLKGDVTIFFADLDQYGRTENEYTHEGLVTEIREMRGTSETIKNYEEWKKEQNQKEPE